VHHVVSAIVAPFGEPIEARPPVPTLAERLEEKAERRRIKQERRRLRDGGVEEGIQEGEGDVEVAGVKLGELEVGFEGLPINTERIEMKGEEQSADTPAVGEPVEEVQEEKPAKKGWWR